jgi:hypothetical protein
VSRGLRKDGVEMLRSKLLMEKKGCLQSWDPEAPFKDVRKTSLKTERQSSTFNIMGISTNIAVWATVGCDGDS